MGQRLLFHSFLHSLLVYVILVNVSILEPISKSEDKARESSSHLNLFVETVGRTLFQYPAVIRKLQYWPRRRRNVDAISYDRQKSSFTC